MGQANDQFESFVFNRQEDPSRLIKSLNLRTIVLSVGSNMLIYDRESNDIVEDFPVANIHRPIAFSHSNHIYDNILMFTVRHVKESEGKRMKFGILRNLN